MLWDFAVRSMIYSRVTVGIIANVEIVLLSGGKVPSGQGWGCLSVPHQTSTHRESGLSFVVPMRLTRAGRGFLAR